MFEVDVDALDEQMESIIEEEEKIEDITATAGEANKRERNVALRQ